MIDPAQFADNAMNPDLSKLHPYPFEKLAALKADSTPPRELPHIALSIGEPQHAPPKRVLEALAEQLPRLASYPATRGLPELRNAIADWASRRFHLPAGSFTERNLLPVNGTREALFAIAQAVVDPSARHPLVVSPNPFYQIYEGAALLSGAQLHLLNCTPDNDFIPDFGAVSAATWRNCQLVYLCSPGNPAGAVVSSAQWRQLIELADRYDFVIAADECYSEIYFDEQAPPTGLLQVCAETGRLDYARCLVFNSLSKRSNLPGLRSGFVGGDAALVEQFLRYRTYQGCAMPVPSQLASALAWQDEAHVEDNRRLYREKFDAVLAILGDTLPCQRPDAGFYLWPETPLDDQTFARELFARQNITVLPGSYLGREAQGINPGANRVRMALVAPLEDCIIAAKRIREFVRTL